MDYTMSEVLQFVRENDVKFIRLAFSDIFGVLKNISIMPDELPRAFEQGISFDASSVRGFMNVDASDLFITPDPGTLSILPWRPAHGRVIRLICDVKYPDGTPFEGCGRTMLRRAVEHAAQMGYVCKIGSECEFYLFQTDEQGDPTAIPYDRGGYCDIAPRDKGENVRREICLTLEEMGIQPESSHHESGPGQNEIDFKYNTALAAADDLATFKMVVKTVAAQNGLHASFMPKPLFDQPGSGLHINLSLYRNGINLFHTSQTEHSAEAESFMAGILDKIPEITAFLNPLTNSYERFGHFEAPKYLTWSHRNRSQLIRIPASRDEFQRMELRSSDPSCNPYLSFALLLEAGLLGIEEKRSLCEPLDVDLYHADPAVLQNIGLLPPHLGQALELSKNSRFVGRVMPPSALEAYYALKLAEWERCSHAADPRSFEHDLYFPIV